MKASPYLIQIPLFEARDGCCSDKRSGAIRETGMTLVELLIAMALGLIISGTLALIFVSNTRTRHEIEKTSQQIENGRYTIQLILEDVRLAGYYGEFSPASLTTPTTLPDPAQADVTSLKAAVVLPLQGYDNGSNMPAPLVTLLSDLRAGTDILVIRRTSTCFAGTAGCSAVDTTRNTYFQTTLCNNQLNNLPATSQFLLSTTISEFTTNNSAVSGAANPPAFLAKKDCLSAAAMRAYYTRIYFIANNNQPDDGIPTLKMAELGAGSFSISPLVDGIEQLQIEYGVDTNNDEAPDSYTSIPANTTDWRRVTTVKVHVLARNTLTSTGFTDTRSYVLGLKADRSNNIFGPYNDAYKRHAYTTVARLNNVAGRLE